MKQNADLIDKYRHINVDGDWYTFTVDGIKEDMAALGVDVRDVFFSGFCSQGAGACFAGSVDDWPKLLAVLPLSGHYPETRKLALRGDLTLSFLNSGRYCHEHSVSYSFAYDDPGYLDYNSDDAMLVGLARVHSDMLAAEAADFEKEFQEWLRDKMREAYKALEEEYEYLTSDEAVWDTLVANDMHKVEEEEDA